MTHFIIPHKTVITAYVATPHGEVMTYGDGD